MTGSRSEARSFGFLSCASATDTSISPAAWSTRMRSTEPLPAGLCHVVFEVDDLEAARARALAAGATEVTPATRVEAGFGVRDVAFLRSPGGILFELIKIIENSVPRP